MKRNKIEIPLALRRWWAGDGVLIASTLSVLAPGVLAFIGEWMRTEGMIQPERLLCCIGAGIVASLLAMLLGAVTFDWLAGRKGRS